MIQAQITVVVSLIGVALIVWTHWRNITRERRENFDKVEKFLTRNLQCPVCGHNRIGSFCARCGEPLNPPRPEVSRWARRMELAQRAFDSGEPVEDTEALKGIRAIQSGIGVTITQAPPPGVFKPVCTPAPPPSKYHFFDAAKIR